MAYRYGYALEKFNRALYTMATGGGDVRQRLLVVFEGDLLMIQSHHLPPEVRSDYEWVRKQLSRYKEKYAGQRAYFYTPDGRFDHVLPTSTEATLSRIRRATGVKIAQRLFSIWSFLEEDGR